MIGRVWLLIREVVLAVGFVFVVNTCVFANYYIPSESMLPTLHVGDRVLVSKFPYGYSRHSMFGSPALFPGRVFAGTVKRGDIAVFKHPRDNATDLIKRVVGLPGDTVEVRNGALLINGAPVAAEPVAPTDTRRTGCQSLHARHVEETMTEGGPRYLTLNLTDHGPGDDRGPFTVPERHYFAMGDNRDNSSDSRWPTAVGVGFVPAENLIGRAEVILWSWTGRFELLEPATWREALCMVRAMTVLR